MRSAQLELLKQANGRNDLFIRHLRDVIFLLINTFDFSLAGRRHWVDWGSAAGREDAGERAKWSQKGEQAGKTVTKTGASRETGHKNWSECGKQERAGARPQKGERTGKTVTKMGASRENESEQGKRPPKRPIMSSFTLEIN